jgi:hypothetical protein
MKYGSNARRRTTSRFLCVLCGEWVLRSLEERAARQATESTLRPPARNPAGESPAVHAPACGSFPRSVRDAASNVRARAAESSNGQGSAPLRPEAAPSVPLLSQPRTNLPAIAGTRSRVPANSALAHPAMAPVAFPAEEPKVPSLASCANSRARLSRHRGYAEGSKECCCARSPDRAQPPPY